MEIKNIIFDYGGVLLYWDPHFVYDEYFKNKEKANWFLENVCTYQWNAQNDAGKPIAEGTAELIAKFPEWEKEIRMYYDEFEDMIWEMNGMEVMTWVLKVYGYHVFGLTNWSAETFARIRHKYHVFDLMEDMVISGEEHITKPDPRIFDIAIKRFGVKPEETIFVDDNLANVETAKSLGFNVIHFKTKDEFIHEIERLTGREI